MKSILFIVLFVIIVGNYSYGQIQRCVYPEGLLVEFRPSYFYPISSNFREIFGDGDINYQLTAAYPVYRGRDSYQRGLNLWMAIDYFSKSGSSDPLGNKTDIKITPCATFFE